MCSLIIPARKRCSKGWRLHSRDLLPQGTDGNSSERAGICHPMERESATADRSEVTFDRIDGAEMEFAAQDRHRRAPLAAPLHPTSLRQSVIPVGCKR